MFAFGTSGSVWEGNPVVSGGGHARQLFDAGVLSLGIAVAGLSIGRDVEYASLAFRRACEYEPLVCNAWLGVVCRRVAA
jgi:hypothetical protein